MIRLRFVVALTVLLSVMFGRYSNGLDAQSGVTPYDTILLSNQSRKVLAQVDAPLKIRVFTQEAEFRRYQATLKAYKNASMHISVEYIDPDKNPAVAHQNLITTNGTVVVEYEGRTVRITSVTETDLTEAITRLLSGPQQVYFTQGHGEKDTALSNRSGYSTITAALGNENFVTVKLAFGDRAAVPERAAVVVIAGPRVDFDLAQVAALKTYLATGGRLMLLMDPSDKLDGPPLTHLIALAHDWGIAIGNDIVLDLSGVGKLLGTDASVPVATKYPPHPITEGFNLLTAYPLARSVTPIPGGINGHLAQGFVETTKSWAETDVKRALTTGQATFKEGDRPGPISIAAAVSARITTVAPSPGAIRAPERETRVAVLGDSDFVTNAAIGIQGNRDFFIRALRWLSQQPIDEVFYMSSGGGKLGKGDGVGAMADFTQAIALDPKDAAAYTYRGYAKMQIGDLDGAIADFTRVLALDPKNLLAYVGRGLAKQNARDFAGAIADMTQAIALDATQAALYQGRGVAKVAQGDSLGAIADYTQAIALDPKVAAAYNLRGNAKQNQGDLDGAVADYTQAIALTPENAVAYSNRGLAKAVKGDIEGGLADETHAITLDPKSAIAYQVRGEIKAGKGDFAGAIIDETSAISLGSKVPQAYVDRGVARMSLGDLNGAIADVTQALALNPTSATAFAARGLYYFTKSQYDRAIMDWDAALKIEPTLVGSLYSRGVAKLRNGDAAGGNADIAAATRREPDIADQMAKRGVKP